MIPTGGIGLRMLRLGLLLATCGWGISFFFTFALWDMAVRQLQDMGAEGIRYDPLMDYWLRMASCAFGCIGLACALACYRPSAWEAIVRLSGPFHFIVGTTLAISAWKNGLQSELHPTFIPDITFCFVTALLIQLPLSLERRKCRSLPGA